MAYKATQKQYIIKENTIITPDNFSSWELINYGTNPVVINETIVLQQNEKYKVELDSDVIFESSINIKFDTTTAGSNRAAIILFYVKPI